MCISRLGSAALGGKLDHVVSPSALGGHGSEDPHLIVQLGELGLAERPHVLGRPLQTTCVVGVAEVLEEPQPVVEVRAAARAPGGPGVQPDPAALVVSLALMGTQRSAAGKTCLAGAARES